MQSPSIRVVVLLALLLAQASPAAARASRPSLTVYAASDLAFALEALVPRFEAASGAEVTVVLGSTGNLARQIEHGAPADVFLAADPSFVDRLRAAGAVLPGSLAPYAAGRLVLATATRAGPRLERIEDLLRPWVRRVSIANPEHAPYGRAAQEALVASGLWEAVRPKLVYAESVRQALQHLQSGAAQAGLVARSVADVPEVAYVPIDPTLHRPIDQVGAVTARSGRPDLAGAFLDLLTGPVGREVLARYGFAAPRAARP